MNKQDFDPTHKRPDSADQTAKVFAFLWTYPIMNYLLASMLICFRWAVDHKMLHENIINMRLERQRMNSFLWMVVLLVVLMYLLYMMTLPINMTSDLDKLFKFLAIFNFIIAVIVTCLGFVFVKKMMQDIPGLYSKMVLAEAVVFTSAQLVSGIFCFWLGTGGIRTLILTDRDGGRNIKYAALLMPFFILTEFVPAIVFAFTLRQFGKVRFE